jgi:hypothetical protein
MLTITTFIFSPPTIPVIFSNNIIYILNDFKLCWWWKFHYNIPQFPVLNFPRVINIQLIFPRN